MPERRQLSATARPVPSEGDESPVLVGAALLVIAIAVALAYGNSLHGPYVYDDKPSITYNASIRSLWSPAILTPPGAGATVSGRPVLNASLALNYALGGLDVRGYHATNILIHVLAALTLFGLVRRTLRLPVFSRTFRQHSLMAAWAVALLWAVHPLQTEAVSYLVQRAESLMSLFYLLTLYCFVRSVESGASRAWRIGAWIGCLLGMATKENMVSAPVAVLLFDRAFVTGSLRAAWRERWRFHVALALTWIPLGVLVATTGGNRGGSAGFDVGVTAMQYWLTQFPALLRYARLAVWPHPLIFDYGAFYITRFATVIGPAMLVTTCIAGTGYAAWRYPRIGFPGIAALAILAPTSLVPGTTQMIVEHRMYLPLASIACLIIPLATLRMGRSFIVATASVAIALGVATSARNRAYASDISLWADTVAKVPNNGVAHSNLGAALGDAGFRREAMVEHRIALKLSPNYAPLLANLGIAMAESGHPVEALTYVTRATEIDPANAQAHLNMGVTLDLLHRPDEAFPHYERALQLNPLLPAVQNDFGNALCRVGRIDEGMAHLHRALELQPNYPDAYFNLAAALVRAGRMDEARATFATALSFNPRDATAHLTWANFLVRQKQDAEAFQEYETAIRLDPASADTHYAYATALASSGRYENAVKEYEAALQLRSAYPEAHNNLGNTLLVMNRVSEAIPHYEASLRLRPANPSAENNLGLALARAGRLAEAASHFENAVRLDPSFTNARENLARAKAQLGE